jgi:CheY-like chemotaxis protein
MTFFGARRRDARDLLVPTLGRCGADVVAVSTSVAALDLLQNVREKPFDVLVSDIGMPGKRTV